jgi:hypothetical protein
MTTGPSCGRLIAAGLPATPARALWPVDGLTTFAQACPATSTLLMRVRGAHRNEQEEWRNANSIPGYAGRPRRLHDRSQRDIDAAPAPLTAPDAAASANTEPNAVATGGEKHAFQPPPGYKAKVLDWEIVYCRKMPVLGSRFPKEVS